MISYVVFSLVCKCEKAALKKGYAGFAIHFWGECYGKSMQQINALAGRKQSSQCTGDRTFTGCHAKNDECVGHAYTDFVYKIKYPN